MVVRLRTRLRIIALLLAVPLGMAITVLCQAQGLQPYYDGIATYDYDPTCTYLMGGLSVLKGEIPAFADHPGTLTHILVALAIALASSFPWWSELPVDSRNRLRRTGRRRRIACPRRFPWSGPPARRRPSDSSARRLW